MKDVQSQSDTRGIDIRKVGVKNISYPITVLDKKNRLQHTVASINMYVNLPHHFKGTHMSRFVEILNRCHGAIELKSFHAVLQEMKEHLRAEAAHFEMEFPYFIHTRPDADKGGAKQIGCRMHGRLGEQDNFSLTVSLPISLPPPLQASGSLPRSFGRWGVAEITLSFQQFLWIEDIIQLADSGIASCRGKNGNGLTVELVTRTLAETFARQEAIHRFHIRVVNLAEGYDTFAEIDWQRSGKPASWASMEKGNG